MTTRMQKKTTEATTSNASESGVIQDMLTSETIAFTNPVNGISTIDPAQANPAKAKDVEAGKTKDLDRTINYPVEQRKIASPAKAKDGTLKKKKNYNNFL